MALLLARRQRRLPSTPSLTRFFSNSSPIPPPKSANSSVEKPPQPPSDSSFTDVKTSLNPKSTQAPNRDGSRRFSDNQSRGSLQGLSIKLAKFQRSRSAAPPPKVPTPSISFEALHKQVVAANPWKNLETLSGVSSGRNALGRGEALPRRTVLGKEMEGEEFLKIYREDELGEKLRMLRPEGKKKEEEGWFSLEELNQRLVKLRQVEEKEVRNQRGNFSLLRNLIDGTLEDEKAQNEAVSLQNLDVLGYLDGTPEYKHYPPKDELVETYFHSDNLSSAEKMKIELTKVREDFKMSESDCGSARVQVAQLTTKIKHLSEALHKKDKHSKKGLVAMVQKRKKLLKYLRRTDWDSYCLVLSKLSLRDNPDYKL